MAEYTIGRLFLICALLLVCTTRLLSAYRLLAHHQDVVQKMIKRDHGGSGDHDDNDDDDDDDVSDQCFTRYWSCLEPYLNTYNYGDVAEFANALQARNMSIVCQDDQELINCMLNVASTEPCEDEETVSRLQDWNELLSYPCVTHFAVYSRNFHCYANEETLTKYRECWDELFDTDGCSEDNTYLQCFRESIDETVCEEEFIDLFVGEIELYIEYVRTNYDALTCADIKETGDLNLASSDADEEDISEYNSCYNNFDVCHDKLGSILTADTAEERAIVYQSLNLTILCNAFNEYYSCASEVLSEDSERCGYPEIYSTIVNEHHKQLSDICVDQFELYNANYHCWTTQHYQQALEDCFDRHEPYYCTRTGAYVDCVTSAFDESCDRQFIEAYSQYLNNFFEVFCFSSADISFADEDHHKIFKSL